MIKITMNLEKIVAVSGKPGLYEIISQTKGGIIVQSLIDKKRLPINAMHNVSVLNDIAIYTHDDEIPLRNIFKTIAVEERVADTAKTSKVFDIFIVFPVVIYD